MFSVLIPVFNHARHLDAAVLSALESSLVSEVIMVDDGSSDGSVDAIERIAASHPQRVRVLANPSARNIGTAARLNQLVASARCDWLAVLNSDDEFVSGRFEISASLLEECSADFLFGALSLVDSTGNTTGSKCAFLSPEYALPEALNSTEIDGDNLFTLLLTQNFIATTSNIIFSRELYDNVGQFADYRYCHDWDFSLRALLLGRGRFIPQHLTKYRLHETNTISDSWRIVHEEVRLMLSRFLSDFPYIEENEVCRIALQANRYLHSELQEQDDVPGAVSDAGTESAGPARRQITRLRQELLAMRSANLRLEEQLQSVSAELKSSRLQNQQLQERQMALVSKLHNTLSLRRQTGSEQSPPFLRLKTLIGSVRQRVQDDERAMHVRRVLVARLTEKEQLAFRLLSESGIFDAEYYSAQYGELGPQEDPLIHYITVGSLNDWNPNCWFDVSYYRRTHTDLVGSGLDLLLHFIQHGAGEGRKVNQDWDLAFDGFPFDRETQATVSAFNASGRGYVASSGYGEPRLFLSRLSQVAPAASSPLTDRLVRHLTDEKSLHLLDSFHPRTEPLRSRSNNRMILALGHEGSLTGAPMVLLNLVKGFAKDGYECVTFLKSGGSLLPEYAKHSHVLDLSGCTDPQAAARLYLSSLVAADNPFKLSGTIANSVESLPLAQAVKAFDVPIVYLVHELADGYSESFMQEVADVSETLVFSSQFARDSFREKVSAPSDISLILPQGLLDPDFGSGSRFDARKQLRDELRLPDSAFLVIGCGTYHLRKGTDWFVDIARKTLSRSEAVQDIHFVWIGHGEDHPFSLYYYCNWDLVQYGLQNNVHFIGERLDLSPYFLGSDLFLMTSRQDPFPCVVQNAMAAGLPVIAFDGTGGVPELLSRGGGNILPYGDTDAVAQQVLDYYQDREQVLAVGDQGRQVINRHYRFNTYYSTLRELVFSQQNKFVPGVEDAINMRALS